MRLEFRLIVSKLTLLENSHADLLDELPINDFHAMELQESSHRVLYKKNPVTIHHLPSILVGDVLYPTLDTMNM